MNVLTQSTGVVACRSEAAALESATTPEKTAQTKHKMKLHTSAGRMVEFSQANGNIATGHGHVESLGTLDQARDPAARPSWLRCRRAHGRRPIGASRLSSATCG